MSFNYPVHPCEKQKRQYRNFILSLQNVLPCGACRKNLKTNFAKLPITIKKDMKNRTSFSKYIYNLHQLVNKMLKKTNHHLSFADVRERYEHFRSRCLTNKSTNKKQQQEQQEQQEQKKQQQQETKTMKKVKKESGCTEPMHGKKSKCIIHIVPQEKEKEKSLPRTRTMKKESILIDKQCLVYKAKTNKKKRKTP